MQLLFSYEVSESKRSCYFGVFFFWILGGGQKIYGSCNQPIHDQIHAHYIIPSLYWACVQNEGDTFGTGEGGYVHFGLVLLLSLGNVSMISCLGCLQTFNLQSTLPCGQFGHLTTFFSCFSFLVITPFSIFRSTKQFYLDLNFHTKWTKLFSKMGFPFLCSSYTACHRKSYHSFINGVLSFLSISPSMFSCLSSWWLIADLIDWQM